MLEEKYKGRNMIKITGFIIFVSLLIYGIYFLDKSKLTPTTFTFFIAVVLISGLAFYGFDRLQEIDLKNLRLVLKEARTTISEMKELSKLAIQTNLSLVQRSGRWGGYSQKEKELIKNHTLDVATKLKLSQEEQKDILKEWHMYTELDYVLFILGNQVPVKWPKEEQQKWHNYREGLVDKRPSPSEIRELLKINDSLTKGHEELIKDYEYYIKNKTHRRPEVWENIDYEFTKQLNL
jgi:hypothetical protein